MKNPRKTTYLTLIFAVIFLGPSMFGFMTKFIEFIHVFRGESDGLFAVTPMVNYLLASLGFFCMLMWSTINGMFHDVEAPKYAMLAREMELDREMSEK